MNLAYICISLDRTGFFEYLSLMVTRKAGTSGIKLFLYLFLLAGLVTIFTSNDIVILTFTPIIIYMAKYAKINPVPFLFANFFAANILSTFLYIENPTNIIIAQAFQITFVAFFLWMFLPTVAGGLSAFLILWLYFRKQIPPKITPSEIDPRLALQDVSGAIYNTIVLGICLTLLSIFVDLGWLVTFFCAMACLARDFGHDLYMCHKGLTEAPISPLLAKLNTEVGIATEKPDEKKHLLPRVYSVGSRMPWKIIPFVVGMFILVEAMRNAGWIDLFAAGISTILLNPYTSILEMTTISALAANFMNNQPMTIFFGEILLNPNLAVSHQVAFGSVFALIMGSNYGACFTMLGALAGIMWCDIANDQKIKIGPKQFAKLGFSVVPIVILAASSMLTLEILLFPGLIP